MNDIEKCRDAANLMMPAFPISHGGLTLCGLTKREYFAGLAMQGWLASFAPDAQISPEGKIQIAELAVQLSDALLDELEKTK